MGNKEEEGFMKIYFSSRKKELNDDFKKRAEKKLKKLTRFFGADFSAEVMVNVEKNRETVEITVRHSGLVFRAEETSLNMMESLDKAIDIIIRQIRKNKTRLEKRLYSVDFDSAFEDKVEEEPEYKVVKTKKFSIKPLSVDEAILQMNMVGHQFFVFVNDSTDRINVIYKRNDGNYGLLEPDID